MRCGLHRDSKWCKVGSCRVAAGFQEWRSLFASDNKDPSVVGLFWGLKATRNESVANRIPKPKL